MKETSKKKRFRNRGRNSEFGSVAPLHKNKNRVGILRKMYFRKTLAVGAAVGATVDAAVEEAVEAAAAQSQKTCNFMKETSKKKRFRNRGRNLEFGSVAPLKLLRTPLLGWC